MGFNESDFMRRALELARRGLGHTRPNPPVGAVIACNGRIVGEGWHRRAGSDHAEVAAIKDARRRLGPSGAAGIPKDSTIYVTLEPCSRPGRVGACTDAIVAAGIRRVVYAVPDPNPKNRGRARRVLARHGVSCECWAAGRSAASVREGDEQLRRRECVAAARRLVTPFAKHVATGLPYVVVKVAMSLDGRICDDHGDAKWISSGASRRVTGLMRSEVDAIMVGAETVRRDDPSLLCHQKRTTTWCALSCPEADGFRRMRRCSLTVRRIPRSSSTTPGRHWPSSASAASRPSSARAALPLRALWPIRDWLTSGTPCSPRR